jgi:hypothetical protein
MKNSLLTIFIVLIFGLPLSAQDSQRNLGPSKGTVDVSLLLGKAQSFSNWLVLPDANSSSYSIQTPGMYSDITNNSAINMIGVEGKWFFSKTWALRLTAVGNISAGKGYEGSPGVPAAAGTTTVLLPFYAGVPSLTNHEVIVNVGFDKYFATSNDHLFWYLAPVINFHYNRLTGKNSADFVATSQAPYFAIVDPGTARYGEGVGIGLSGITGCEYYTKEGVFFGFEIRGANYTYLMNTQRPMDGLSTLKSDSHNFSFLSQPTLKIGFRF